MSPPVEESQHGCLQHSHLSCSKAIDGVLCTQACILMSLIACCCGTWRAMSDPHSGCLQTHGPCKTITTRFRPVPLTWHWCHAIEGQTELVPLLNRRASGLSHPLRPTAMREPGWDALNAFRWGVTRNRLPVVFASHGHV